VQVAMPQWQQGQQMAEMFMNMMFQQMGGGYGGKGGYGYSQGGGRSESWKSVMHKAWQTTHGDGSSAVKDVFAYDTSEAEGGGYTCSVSCAQFSDAYIGQGKSKKDAEDAAIQKAVRAEFPTFAAQADKAAKSQQASGQGGERSANVLRTALARKTHSSDKGDITFTVVESSQNLYTCTVTSPHFAEEYVGDESVGKKGAEDSAAMKALQAEFADTPYIWMAAGGQVQKQQRKRKHSEGPAEVDAKGKLQNGMMLVNGSTLPKGSISYETTKSGSDYTSTVTIASTGQSYTGVAKKDSKAAELAAAEAACEALNDQFEPLFAQSEAKKKAKKEESKEKFLAVIAAKKAAKKPAALTDA